MIEAIEEDAPDSALAQVQAPGAVSGPCPVSSDFLPPTLRKHVEPSSPTALRMMAAKALVPFSPSDMVTALFMLTFDTEEVVRDTAQKTCLTLPDRLLAAAFRDERVPPKVLAFFLEVLGGHDVYAEMLILNANTPDESIAQFSSRCNRKLSELISQNQLRLLRHEEIIRQLCRNSNASPSLLDVVCDFAVRSGLVMADVPQMKAARVRLFGPEVASQPSETGPSAEEILNEYRELADESASPLEESKKFSVAQRVMKMNVAEKIKLATKGNKDARGILIRDANRLVAVAVIRSPKVTMGEVRMAAMNRAMHDDVLRVIYTNREWTKDYPVKLSLVKNPKIPQAISLRWLSTLRESDVKSLVKDKNVPHVVSMTAKKMMDKKTLPKRGS